MADLSDQTPWQTKDPAPAPASRAKRHARKRNRDEWQIVLMLPGSVKWNAGTVVGFDSTFGNFAGNYLVTKCVHSWEPGSGYRTQLHCRKVLTGY